MKAGISLPVLLLAVTASAALYPDRKHQFMPKPAEVSADYSTMVRLTDRTKVVVACPTSAVAAAGVEFVRSHAERWLGCSPAISPATADGFASSEAYRLKVDGNGIEISAGGVAGVRHAISTLRQSLDPVPGVETFSGWQAPLLTVRDEPALAWRGIHICWFPENTVQDIERYLRFAAYYKYNYFVLESWGMFVSEKHPGLHWPESPMTKAEVRRLAAIARDLGITLIPQVNIFGHASGSRRSGGKHAVIDLDRKHLPLFEPYGWNWCLSNPSARQVVKDIVLEMHAAFGNPPYFHIGCDEATDPTCSLCRAGDYRRIVASFVTEVHDALKSRNCQSMAWHAMFFDSDAKSWCPSLVKPGAKEQGKFMEMIPNDLVLCYYAYDKPKEGTGAWPGAVALQKKGFPTVLCPWEHREGVYGQAKYIRETGLLGLLMTTWHHIPLSATHFFENGARATWEKHDGRPLELLNPHTAAHHLRTVGWDVPNRGYRDTGWWKSQIPAEVTR